MPREHRKRGKKKKEIHEQPEVETESYAQATSESNPQWMETNDEINLDAPFGYVDPDVKGYFRTVDTQIQDWQSYEYQDTLNDEGKASEDKRMFLVAALSESSGKELQLATDPDCSVILERMLHSMDDVVLRVFADRLCGSYTQLAQHRFGSHVCQTLFEVGAATISREARGNVAKSSDTNDKEGVLRTMTILTLGICEELLPSLPQLILDPFAAHVVLSLLVLLIPEVRPAESTSSHSSLVRSKKSAVYKSRQGSMKSILASGVENTQNMAVPPSFKAVAGKFVDALRESVDGNEIRALAANKVANPVLQVMIDIEALLGSSESPGSIIDSVLMGAISTLAQGGQIEHSDYIETLLRDPTASHLFETLVRRAPEQTFNSLWNLYFRSKLAKLSSHPVANFVVSKAVARLTPDVLSETVQEIGPIANKLIKAGRTGVLKALVDQAVSLGAHEDVANQLVCQALDVMDDNVQLFVPCLLALKSVKAYKKSVGTAGTIDPHTDAPAHEVENSSQAEPTIQGAVLLQAMLRLSAPHNQSTIKSIQAQTLDDLIKMSRHAVSSRVLDAFLDSPSVPLREKRKFLMGFIGHYHVLVDDRIGSRVGDRCWAHADPFLKERIARSVLPHETALSASYYGKYFARNLHLSMLKRDPTAWRDMQKDQKAVSNIVSGSNIIRAVPNNSTGESGHTKKRKRPATEEDEIDVLFSKTPHPKESGGPVNSTIVTQGTDVSVPTRNTIDDPQLNEVLGAIKKVSKKEGMHCPNRACMRVSKERALPKPRQVARNFETLSAYIVPNRFKARIPQRQTPPNFTIMSDATALKDQGNKAFQAKRYDEAIDLFTQAIALDPSNHVLYSNRSAAKAGKKLWEEALADAEECIKVNPTWAKGYARKGAALHGAHRWEEAITAYEEGIKIEDSPALQKGLKEVKEAQASSDADEGVAGIGKMFSDPNLFGKLASNPKTSHLLADQGFVNQLKMLQANPQLAGSSFNDPRMIQVLGALMGIDLQATTRPEGSNEMPPGFGGASQPSPSSPPPKPEPTSQPAKPKEDVKMAEPEPEPEDDEAKEKKRLKAEADAEKAKGAAAYKSRDFAAAEEAFSKAWEISPTDITYLTNLAATYFEKGDYDKCIETCEKAVDEGRGMRADFKLIAKAFGRIGSAYYRKDDFDNAIKFFSKSLSEHRTPDILNKLREAENLKSEKEKQAYINPELSAKAREEGNTQFKNGDFAGSVKSYTESIKRDPGDARGYNNRAAAYTKLAALPEALKDVETAIKVDPKFVKAYIRKSNVLFAMREYTKAMEAAQEASDADTEKQHTREIEQLLQKIASALYEQQSGESDEQTLQRAMRDPEVASIMNDPIMQQILQQAQQNPAALQDHMKNPIVAKKIQKLIAAGIIKTRR